MGLSAFMMVYRCQKTPVGRLTRGKDVFFLGAHFGVPGAKFLWCYLAGYVYMDRHYGVNMYRCATSECI